METGVAEALNDSITSDPFDELVGDLVVMSNSDLDAHIRSLELEHRALEARLAAAIVVAEQHQIYRVDGHRSMKGYLIATCNWSSAEAVRWRSIARMLTWFPILGAYWLAGRVGHNQVALFGRTYGNRRVTHRFAEFLPLLLKHATDLPFDGFEQCVKRFVSHADQDGAHQDRDHAVKHRTAHAAVNGTELDVGVRGGDPVTATEVVGIIGRFEQQEFDRDVAARLAEHGDHAAEHELPRTATQRRFDAIVEMCRAAATALQPGTAAVPLVNIVIDETSFNELQAASGLAPGRLAINNRIGEFLDTPDVLKRRCETTEGVPVHPHDVLRAMLTGYVRRVVIDSHEVVINMGRKSRLYTGPAREAAMLLVQACQHPGCELPAAWSQVDHNREWKDGGLTDQDNSTIECARHNVFKSVNGWHKVQGENGHWYTQRADGTYVIPTGMPEPDVHDPVEEQRVISLARQRIDRLISDRSAA